MKIERNGEGERDGKSGRDFGYCVGPQQGDLRLSGPPSGQSAGGETLTRNRRVPADLRADSLATVPPTPPSKYD
ncbi:hypothetical protein PoB_005932300 [Plakobranchus ocellatus]|uniref:Uncharacterized protein n=1 Tax=Plakobranchus ocellatus TaxID=259542 RepID=A0AAV4CN05_9GAST|nr:hypothetical protein PoB_005932300 [Plakobranchus ocellatus]